MVQPAPGHMFRIFLVALPSVSRSLRRLNLFGKQLSFILRHFKSKASCRRLPRHQAPSLKSLLHND